MRKIGMGWVTDAHVKFKSSDDAHLSYEGQTVQTSCPRSLVSFFLIV